MLVRLLLAGPADPMPLLCGLMPRILFAVQVAAGGRDRGMAKIVPHIAQVDLLVGHVRAGGVAQPLEWYDRHVGQHYAGGALNRRLP